MHPSLKENPSLKWVCGLSVPLPGSFLGTPCQELRTIRATEKPEKESLRGFFWTAVTERIPQGSPWRMVDEVTGRRPNQKHQV
jgi:hypothetical protein